ncbi:hypothetical protein AAG570_010340 [Ranatra chinensis]|uniref:RING-type E3 ubiquitin transferase n=1 Tax=Ranatra chinensis TaxID=642074 RepID=A0ABD0YMI0_9HEMI
MATGVNCSRPAKKLSFEDVLCPICRTIFIEPVSLPCKHVVCKQCLEKTVESNALTCPICRTRIGSFLRLSRSSGKLVDHRLWEDVKQQFPKEVSMKQKGEEDGIADKFLEIQSTPKLLAKRGSIRQEFEEMLKKLKMEEEKSRLAEEIASKKLAEQLMNEELVEENNRKRRQQEIAQSDMIFIRNLILSEKITNKYNIFPVDEGPSCSDGRDSIAAELRHFTPICIMPKTPPKILPDGKIQETKLLKPINMTVNTDDDSCPSPQRSLHKSSLQIYSNNFVRTKGEDEASTVDNDQNFSRNSLQNGNLDDTLESYSNVRNFLPEIKSQELIQSRIEQERQDFALALKLQTEWNMNLPKKHQHNYMLRSTQKYKKKKLTSDS